MTPRRGAAAPGAWECEQPPTAAPDCAAPFAGRATTRGAAPPPPPTRPPAGAALAANTQVELPALEDEYDDGAGHIKSHTWREASPAEFLPGQVQVASSNCTALADSKRPLGVGAGNEGGALSLRSQR
jgi:hypothetical protein